MQPQPRRRRRLPMAPPETAAADPTLAADAAQVLEALSELVRVYQFRDRNRICCHDVSVTQCYALQAIARREGMTQRQLAADLYLDKSTLSRVVGALVRKGYVRAQPDPDDGRAVRLAVTAAGRALLGRIERDLLAEQMELVADFPPEVRRATARLMARLARATAGRMGRGLAPAGEDGCGNLS